MNKIVFNDIEIEHICKLNLKNSYLSISKDAKVVLKTPKVSQRFITNLLSEKEQWIKKQLLVVEKNKPLRVNLEDEVLLFGEIYSIDHQEFEYLKDSLKRLRIPNEINILKCYNNFYKIYAQTYLTSRLEYFSIKMGVRYSGIKYKKLKRRWGSCDSKKVITLNTQLLKIEKELIDYVVVHELAHLVYMNHSKDFHNLVECYISDEKLRRKRLREINLEF
ncbi:MAG: SprT family zinc-dependent metalloprotease [Campylobacterota bacterium]|nr:SprT family zinc-dependent metalloprotease [Campylobacterota bacterium]